jgi:hypothetical protein
VDVWIGGGPPVTHGNAPSAGVKGQFAITGEATLPD